MQLQRTTIKIGGESGQGVNSVGEIMAKSIKESGFYSFGYREYPSLIKGGYSSHQIDIADHPLVSPSAATDVLACLSRVSVHAYLPTVRPGGMIVHNLLNFELTESEKQLIAERSIKIEYVDAAQLAFTAGGSNIMANTVLIGVVWQLLGLDLEPVKAVLQKEFARKPEVIEPNLKCLEVGYTYQLTNLQPISLPYQAVPKLEAEALLSGNQLISLGAVGAGVRAYYAYPMTPSSSILSYLASIYHETGMLVKQVEDEISVAQMALGSMFMGTRALVGTSGGGFDLMTESVSMSGMIETPFVCILGQRPGPATGLPTWTAAGDLNLAIYGGHGEYARCVMAVSDAESCYSLIQHAFNLAEEFQIPVIVLTEKEIAESLFQLKELPADVPIKRYVVEGKDCESLVPTDRYKITDTGVSPRWFPGQADATYDANTDEHTEDGSITEEAGPTKAMYDKRLRKLESLAAKLPEPELLGPSTAVLTLVGWGSVKNTAIDALALWNEAHPEAQVNYLHYEYLFPLKTERIRELVEQGQRLVLVENNAFGQLGALITQHTGYMFAEKFLKYDGRPFFLEDMIEFLESYVQ